MSFCLKAFEVGVLAQSIAWAVEDPPKRLIHILIQEIVCNVDDTANEVVLLIHWTGGRHSEIRVPKARSYWGSGFSAQHDRLPL